MTWGERMRAAKQGDVTAAVEAAAPAMPAVAEARVEEPAPVEAAPPEEESPVAAAEVMTMNDAKSAAPAASIVPAATTPEMSWDAAAGATEPKRGFRREDFSAAESSPVVDAADPPIAVRVPDADDAAAGDTTASRRRQAVGGERGGRTDELLEQILVELRRREEQGSLDFSVSKLLAGITQVLALAAMFFAYLNKNNGTELHSTLLLAVTLQTLTISLLIMGKQK